MNSRKCHVERSAAEPKHEESLIVQRNSKRCLDPFDSAQGKTFARHDNIKRTLQGRVATANAYRKLGLKPPSGAQPELL